MNRAFLLLACAVGAVQSADVLTLHSGEEIVGAIRMADDGAYLVRPEGLDAMIRIDAARVRSRSTRSSAAAPQVPPARGAASPAVEAGNWWSCEGSISTGMVVGSITGSGRMERRADGRSVRLDIHDDLACTIATVEVKLLHGGRIGELPVLYGARLGSSQGGVDMLHAGAVAGLGGSDGWRLLLGMDWHAASYERGMSMDAVAGTPADHAEVQVSVTGPGASIEAGWLQRMGDWSIGASGRLNGMRLAGSQSWTSEHGRYAGSEDLDPSWIVAAEIGIVASIVW